MTCTPRAPVIVLALAGVALAGCGSTGRGHASAAEGRRIFVTARCGACHTFAAAGTRGQDGPDFDTSELLDRGQIRSQLDVGDGGMPSYSHRLTSRQEDAVTEFIYQATHARSRP